MVFKDVALLYIRNVCTKLAAWQGGLRVILFKRCHWYTAESSALELDNAVEKCTCDANAECSPGGTVQMSKGCWVLWEWQLRWRCVLRKLTAVACSSAISAVYFCNPGSGGDSSDGVEWSDCSFDEDTAARVPQAAQSDPMQVSFLTSCCIYKKNIFHSWELLLFPCV